ncbi:MAG: kinase [Gammaproteobacteria bacterium]|nr:MAG: kinase [Gammaproteobacteria bacterium]
MVEDTPYVLVIGGANIDFIGLPNNPLIWHDSNPGIIKTGLGGVGRNIAENLVRLGVPSKLLSLVGDDVYGNDLIEKSEQIGVDMSGVEKIDNQRTSTYFAVMNSDDDMAVAIADMGIIDLLTPARLKPFAALIQKAALVVAETNLPAATLRFLLLAFPQTRFLVDPVSVSKAVKIKPLLPCIDTLKPNRLEAEYLTGIAINNLDDARRAVDHLLAQGVKHVFISLGQQGLLCSYGNGHYHCPALPTRVVNATGAGDAMLASIAYGLINKLSPEELLLFANAAAALTLMAATTIAPDLSVSAIKQLLNNQEKQENQ